MNIDDIANAMNNQSGNKPKNTKPQQSAKPAQPNSDPLSGLVNALNQQTGQVDDPSPARPTAPKPAAPKPTASSNQTTNANPFDATYDEGSSSNSSGQPMEMGGMGGLLGALLGGAGASQQTAPDTGSADMGSLLGSLLGGAGASQQPAPDTGSADMGSLLGSLLGGAGASQQPANYDTGSGQADMGSLLGSLLGGAGASQQPANYDTGSGQADMGSLLGSLLGGAGASQQPANYDTGSTSGGLGSLLGALLGGGGSQSNSSMGLLGGLLGGGNTGSPFDALAIPLAKKLGIPPQIASIIVMLVANALLGKNKNRAGEVDVNRAELSDVMALYNSGEFNSSAVQNNQLVQEISQQTGLDHATAARSIGDLLEIMNSQANAQ